MKKVLLVLLSLLLVLSAFGCTKKPDDPVVDDLYDQEFENLMNQWFADEMESDYLSMHFSVKNPESLGLKTPEVTLGAIEVTDEDIDEFNQKYDQIKNYDTSKMSDAQLITYQTVLSYYEILSRSYALEEDYEFLFTPNSGVNNALVTNFQEFEIRSEQDAKDLITLVIDGERYIDECIAYTLDQAEDGIVQTKATLEAVLDQLTRFTSKVEDNELISAFNTQIDAAGYDASLKAEMKDAVVNHLIPAYKRAIDMCNKLMKTAPESKSISEYEHGNEYYQALISRKTSTTKTVNEIQKELEDAIYDTLDSVYEVYDAADSVSYGYTNPEAALEMLKSMMGEDFPAIPKVDYTVSFLDPSVTSENTAAYYIIASVDDYTNNVIKVNPNYGESDPNGLIITLAHEGYPGHLYQHTYYCSTNPSLIRSALDFTAYAEGWAMYVEDWAYYQLEKSSDTAALNSLYDQLMYYIYAYVDILYNYDGYDVDDVANFLKNIFIEEYAKYYAEVIGETVVGDPGLFVPYAYGEYMMLHLKSKAEGLAGKNFNLKEFNTLILNTGDTSFDVLEEIVVNYYSK